MGRRSADLLRGVGFPVIGWSRSRKALPFENFAGGRGTGRFLGAQPDSCLPVTRNAGDHGDPLRAAAGETA
ncbi:hypothetical protein [Mesorhizobium sp. M0579]|uniref:hypothetical protein n=1 Tax=Mesorhizobium sp. M0579 TaxID=2956962 RepID=UPI0033363486